MKVFRLPADHHRIVRLRRQVAGQFAAVVVSAGADDIDLAVLDGAGNKIASDVRVNTDPEVTFTSDGPAEFSVVVINPSDTEAIVVLAVLEK